MSTTSPRNKEVVRSAPSRSIAKRCRSENIPSRIILAPINNEVKMNSTVNSEMKSKYCPSELHRQGVVRRLGRNDSAPPTRLESDGADRGGVTQLRQKDVLFLRKMLAMNKKQEMMLNKRLAKLMEEEELQTFVEEREKNNHVAEQAHFMIKEREAEKQTNDSSVPKNDEYVHLSKTTSENPVREARVCESKTIRPVKEMHEYPISRTTQQRKIQYDINGRRIYHYSDIEKESVDDESEQKHSDFNLKRTGNCYKINKKGSATSRKTFTLKKSTTFITNPGRPPKTPGKTKRKARKEDGDSQSCADSENPLAVHLMPVKAGCRGDGADVDNVVVHCSTVYGKNSRPKNLRVWNYESLHSLKSDNFFRDKKSVSSEQRLKVVGSHKTTRGRPVQQQQHVQLQVLRTPARNLQEGSDTVEAMFLMRETV